MSADNRAPHRCPMPGGLYPRHPLVAVAVGVPKHRTNCFHTSGPRRPKQYEMYTVYCTLMYMNIACFFLTFLGRIFRTDFHILLWQNKTCQNRCIEKMFSGLASISPLFEWISNFQRWNPDRCSRDWRQSLSCFDVTGSWKNSPDGRCTAQPKAAWDAAKYSREIWR